MADISYPPVDVAAIYAAMPAPASTDPSPIAVASAVGAMSPYARADHTHASKTRRMVQAIPAASTYVWTYPTAFPAGVSPMVNAIAQVPAGTADLYNIQVVGTPGNASCTFQINRVSSGLLAVLLGALSLNPTPSAITLHMWAVEA